MDLNRASRYLSYLLRHHPEAAGITLDAHGWADVDQLLAGMKKHRITRAQLEEIVAALEKGDAPLADSLALFEEGTKLIAACSQELDAAEQKVVKLMKGPDARRWSCFGEEEQG